MYSLLEQHIDGSWWYHPGDTFETEVEVEQCFQRKYGHWSPDRPHKAFKHAEPLCQDYATCTFDFKVFEFGGIIHWPKASSGTPIGEYMNKEE